MKKKSSGWKRSPDGVVVYLPGDRIRGPRRMGGGGFGPPQDIPGFVKYLSIFIVSLVLLSGPVLSRPSSVRNLETDIGERRTFQLEASIQLVLNTDTTLRARLVTPWWWLRWLLKPTWQVDMVRGEAMYSLEGKDHSNLEVTLDHLTVEDVGTTFSIRRYDERRAKVTDKEGVVMLSAKGMQTISLRPNQVAMFEYREPHPELTIASYSAQEIERQLAWEQGLLSYINESLATVRDDLSRYTRARIVLDSSLDRVLVGGIFKATDAVSFAAALHAVHPDIRVEIDDSDPDHTVLRFQHEQSDCQHHTTRRSINQPCRPRNSVVDSLQAVGKDTQGLDTKSGLNASTQ